MPVILKKRNTTIREIMDNPDCNKQKLFNTFRYFKYVNQLLSGWKVIYQKYLQPFLTRLEGKATLLDIGCGGCDIPIFLTKWAQQDGYSLEITAIDTDSRILEYLRQHNIPKNITFRNIHTSTLIKESKKFDIVISNHLMHHLTKRELSVVTQHAQQLSRHQVLMNDIRRSDAAYALFYMGTRLIPKVSFIHIDGLLSIKRSFTQDELSKILPEDWQIERPFPFRLLARYQHSNKIARGKKPN